MKLKQNMKKKTGKNMIIYSEEELREMISNLRLVKDFYDEEERIAGLGDESEIELTKYEMLLENHLKNKYKDIDEWLNYKLNTNEDG